LPVESDFYVGLFYDPSRDLKKFLACQGWSRAAVVAFEEHGTQAIFEIAQPPAKGRLSDLQGLRGLPQASMLGGNNRPSQFPKLDGHYPASLPMAARFGQSTSMPQFRPHDLDAEEHC